MIEAGRKSQIEWADGNWIFLDIGFANNAKSCGLLVGSEEAKHLTFCEAKNEIIGRINSSKSPVNLVIEAPLSVCFDEHNNPTARSIERRLGQRPRCWYLQGGCSMMVAAMYLAREISDIQPLADVVLF